MNWSKDKSILLSQICIALFSLLLLALDAGCYWAAGWFARARGMRWQHGALLMASVYCASVFGWIALARLWKLLGSLKRGEVFVAANISRLRAVSRCCAGAAAVCLLSCLYYLPFVFAFAAAGFMALLVRIIKNVFQQAIAMKSELDLTI